MFAFPYKNGDLEASGAPEKKIVDNIPALHHWTRDLAFSPDGKTLYLSVGSGSNVALDMFKEPPGGLEAWNKSHPLGASWDAEKHRADVLSFDPDGNNKKIFATGLRNCSGMTIQPATGQLWCVVNERDELGDNVPFEYATAMSRRALSTAGRGIILAPMKTRAARGRAARPRIERDRAGCADAGPFGAAQYRFL